MKPLLVWPALLLGFALSLSSAQARTLYVATTGNDSSGDGSSSNPYRTIQKAANEAVAGDTVRVRTGIYRETVVVNKQGTAASRIVFEPDTGHSPVISGTEVVTGWTLHDAARKIYRSNAAVTGMSTASDNQIFVDGQMLIEARWPNASLDVSRPTFVRVGAVSNQYHQGNGMWWTSMFGEGNDIAQFDGTDLAGAKIYIIPGVQNFAQTATINHMPDWDIYGMSLQLKDGNGVYLPKAGNPYYIYGAYSLLDHYGEYFINASNTLYLITPTGQPPANSTVEIRRRQYGFDLSNCAYITIRGFELFAAGITTHRDSSNHWEHNGSIAYSSHILIDGIRARYVSHHTDLSHDNVLFHYTNTTGIVLNGDDHEIRNSTIGYSSGNGIVLLGNRNKAYNNIVHDVAYMAGDTAGISTGFQSSVSVDTVIEGNTIVNSSRALILARCVKRGNIAYNRLSNSCLQTADYGAIYAWNNDGQATRIQRNVLSDNYAEAFGAVGIYLDDGSRNYIVDYNLVYNSTTALLLNLANNPDNNWTNNNHIWNNTLSAVGEALGSVNGRALPAGWETSVIRNNIFRGSHTYRSATRSNNLEQTTDPLFVNPLLHDYRLQASSPAINQGYYHATYHPGLSSGQVDIGCHEMSQPLWQAGAGVGGRPSLASSPIQSPPLNLQATTPSFNTVSLTWTDPASGTAPFVLEESLNNRDFRVVARPAPGSTALTLNDLPAGILRHYRLRTALSPYSNTLAVTPTGPRPATEPILAYKPDAYQGTFGGIPNGPVLSSVDAGEWLAYHNVGLTADLTSVSFDISYFSGNNGGRIQIRLGSTSGTLIGTVTVPANGNTTPLTTSVNIPSNELGAKNIYLVLLDNPGIANLASFRFISNGSNTAPAKPSLTATTASSSSIHLGWGSVSGTTQYFLEQSADGAVWYELGRFAAATTSHTHSGMTSGSKRLYRVRAVNAYGQSDWAYASGVTSTALSAYDTWAEALPSAQRDKAAIPYNNGIPNIIAYAMGMNPLSHDFTLLPRALANGNRLALTFRRNTTRNDITLHVEAGNTLSGWTTLATSTNGAAFTNVGGATVSDPGGSGEVQVTITDNTAPTENQPRFLRVRVVY